MTNRPQTDNALEIIRRAYADAGREQPREYNPLPQWGQLAIELREALIHLYFQGRIDGDREKFNNPR